MQNPQDYFSTFDPAKSYHRIMFLAGKPLQSRELNDLQLIIQNQLRSYSKYLVKNGTLLSGGEVQSIDSTAIALKAGTASLDGLPIIVAAGSVALLSDGNIEIIGIAVSESVVTHLQDADLNEPDEQSPNFGQSGAYRYKTNGVWKKINEATGDEVFFPVFTIKDGKILSSSSSSSTNTDAFSTALGRYDFDLHGSYVIEGLELTYGGLDPSEYIKINVAAGRARVFGKDFILLSERTHLLDPINDIRSVLAEPASIVNAQTNYAMRYGPISVVGDVTGIKEVTSNITRGGASGGIDTMPLTPVLSVVEVKQGGTTYVLNTDFIVTGDGINWSPGGAEPSPGSTYTVKYRYVATFAADSFSGSNVVLNSVDANSLVTGLPIYFDYDFFLTRVDRVIVNPGGQLATIRGIPSLPDQAQQPANPFDGSLSLGVVKLSKGQDPVISMADTVVVMPLRKLKKINDDLTDVKYNVGQLSLKDDAGALDPVTNKRGIVVDSLINDVMRDAGDIPGNTAVNSENTLLIPSVFSGSIEASNSASVKLDIASEQNIINQPNITSFARINPYATTNSPLVAAISLAPSTIYSSAKWWWWHGNFLPYNSNTLVHLSRFSNNETIQIKFRGINVGTVVANGSGVAVYNLAVVAGIQHGFYDVEAVGLTSGARARAILTIRLNSVDFSGDWGFNWTGGETPLGYDPIAQTFSLDEKREVSSIDLYFGELPTNTVMVKLVPTKVGIPDTSILLGLASKSHTQVTSGWNKFTFSTPVTLERDVFYALVVVTPNYSGSIGVAQVGMFDSLQAKWIRTQSNNGVCLTSANENTWTPQQDMDIAMKINSPIYSASKTVELGSFAGYSNNITDLLLETTANVPSDSSVRFYATVDGDTIELNQGKPTYMAPVPAGSGDLKFFAEIHTNNTKFSPKMSGGSRLHYGVMQSPASYTQRQFPIVNGASVPFTLKVYLDVYLPSGSSLAVKHETTANNFVTINPSGSSVPIGDDWFTTEYLVTGVALNNTRLRIEMGTSNSLNRPKVRKPRITFS